MNTGTRLPVVDTDAWEAGRVDGDPPAAGGPGLGRGSTAPVRPSRRDRRAWGRPEPAGVGGELVMDELPHRVDGGEIRPAGDGGFLPEMIKGVLERGVAVELAEHLGDETGEAAGRGSRNMRNTSTPEAVRSEVGPPGFDVPRDRADSFEPRLVLKGSRRGGRWPGRDEHQLGRGG